MSSQPGCGRSARPRSGLRTWAATFIARLPSHLGRRARSSRSIRRSPGSSGAGPRGQSPLIAAREVPVAARPRPAPPSSLQLLPPSSSPALPLRLPAMSTSSAPHSKDLSRACLSLCSRSPRSLELTFVFACLPSLPCQSPGLGFPPADHLSRITAAREASKWKILSQLSKQDGIMSLAGGAKASLALCASRAGCHPSSGVAESTSLEQQQR